MLHGGEKLPDGDPLERPPRGIRVEPRDREELLNQVRGAGNAFIKPREVLRERLRGFRALRELRLELDRGERRTELMRRV